MANAKIFVPAIFIIVLTFQSALTRIYDDYESYVMNKYSTDQLLGDWFFVAAVNIVPQSEPLKCVTLTMRKTENRYYVESIVSTLDDVSSHKYKWMTQLNNDKLYHYQ
ncbi:hypothetical protein PV327_010692, partial [Microctonus hyperodae]